MKTFYAFVLLTFIGLLYIGCSDKSISPIETTGVNDNPVNLQKVTGPGAWIIRHQETGWFSSYYDENSGLLLTLGLQDNSLGCDGITDIYDIKDLYLPNADPNLRRLIAKQKSNLAAMVWQVTPCPCGSGLCDFIANNEPTAIGVVNFRYNDNDYLAWMQGNNNSNAFITKANGTIEGQDGTFYNLNFMDKVMWDGDDGTRLSFHYKIQLTPTGQ